MNATLASYYQAIDENRIDDALAMLHEKVGFVIVLPTKTRRGRSRAEMGDYLTGRGVSDRKHVVLRESRDGDLEFVYGKVTDGPVTTGRFLSAARLGPDGRLASYQVPFDVEHDLLED